MFLKNPLINLHVYILEHIENHLFGTTIGMLGQVIFDGSHSDCGGHLVRKTELACGDTAEGDAFKMIFIGTSHDASVA